mmetsp:Transcript_116751/g.341820  ORF Transcript_116751/g.341820 Transcript_116751/m.341820 type:complete len:144 (-) Transcript_116751:698-1129(-)
MHMHKHMQMHHVQAPRTELWNLSSAGECTTMVTRRTTILQPGMHAGMHQKLHPSLCRIPCRALLQYLETPYVMPLLQWNEGGKEMQDKKWLAAGDAMSSHDKNRMWVCCHALPCQSHRVQAPRQLHSRRCRTPVGMQCCAASA